MKAVLWLTATALAAAGPTTGPAAAPTSREIADQWLARADGDLAGLGDTRPADFMFDKAELAVATCEAGPTDRRRETARRAVRSVADARAEAADSAESHAAAFDIAAGQMAEIGDLKSAAAMLAESDRPTALPSKKLENGPVSPEYARAFALIALGRADEITDLPPWRWAVFQASCKFRDLGRDDLADQLLQVARSSKRCTGGEAQSIAWAGLAGAGYFSEAFTMAQIDPPADGHLFHLFGDQIRIARMAVRAGDKTVVVKLRDSMLERLQGHLNDDHTEQELRMLVGLTAEAGDIGGLDEISDFYKAHPVADSVPEIESMLALAYVDAGNTGKAGEHLERVIKAVQKEYADPAVSDRRKFEAGMCLTKTYARLGDTESADRAMAAIPFRPDVRSTDAMQPYFELESAYAAAGLYDRALKLAKAGDPTNLDWPEEMIACEMAFAGHYDDAVKLAMQIKPPGRMPTLYYIAMRQISRHDVAHLDWIDRVPTPQERVLLDIFVANAILGRRDRFLEDRMRDFGPHRPGPEAHRGH